MMDAKMSMSKMTPETSLQPEKEDEWSILNCNLTFLGKKKEKEVLLFREDESTEQHKVR